MRKQKIKIDESTFKLIGLIILIPLASFYFFTNPKKHTTNGLIEVTGVIHKTPDYLDGGVDNPPYIMIYLKNNEKKFIIEGCALRVINNEIILNLKPNDKIALKVKQNDYLAPKTFLNKTVSIFGIKLPGQGDILNIDKMNSCENKEWKRFLLLLPFIGTILFVTLVFKVKN